MAQIGRKGEKGIAVKAAGLALAAALGSAATFGLSSMGAEEVPRSEGGLIGREASDEDAEKATDSVEEPTAEETPQRRILVHIDGEVAAPGVYAAVGEDIRLADIVELAGGLAEAADTEAINLAAPVEDGQKLHIPAEGELEQGAAVSQAAVPQGTSAGLVDINRATAEELMELPGVGEATAEAIIRDREQYGPFASAEDLMRVSGIGQKKFDRMKELILV